MRASTLAACGFEGVQAILQHIQIARRQGHGEKQIQRVVHLVEVISLKGRARFANQFVETPQRPAIQDAHVRKLHLILCGIEVVKIAEHEAHGIAKPTISFGDAIKAFFAAAHVLAEVFIGGPESQNFGARFLGDLGGGDDIAERLRHFSPLHIRHKAMCHQRLERRLSGARHGREKRSLKPAAMLIAAFQIDVGWKTHAAAALLHGRPADT